MSLRPLEGLKVLEFGHVVAGPFAGMLLADLGADVVKVEPPNGDQLRGWPPFKTLSDGSEFSLSFTSVNRGKRSICADLHVEEDRRKILSLACRSDVILENYRPGVLKKFGLDFSEVSRQHVAHLVFCSVSGYGQNNAYAGRGAYDVVIQGESGLMSVTGRESETPVKCGVAVGDFTAGLFAVVSILAALETRRREIRSVYVDCSMLASLISISALQTAQYWGTGDSPSRLGSAHPLNAPYQAFQASDRPFVIAAGNDSMWRAVALCVSREDLLEDTRFADQTARVANQRELALELQREFRTRTAKDWLAKLGVLGVPSGPVNTYSDVLGDPRLESLNLIGTVGLPDGERTQAVQFPVSMSGVPLDCSLGPPALGADEDEVYRDWLP